MFYFNQVQTDVELGYKGITWNGYRLPEGLRITDLKPSDSKSGSDEKKDWKGSNEAKKGERIRKLIEEGVLMEAEFDPSGFLLRHEIHLAHGFIIKFLKALADRGVLSVVKVFSSRSNQVLFYYREDQVKALNHAVRVDNLQGIEDLASRVKELLGENE